MKALVTGGGGFLGGAIVEALRARGDEVASFSRASHAPLAAAGIRQIHGDLADAASVLAAVRAVGPDVVFHAAAKVGAWGPYSAFRRANVDGAGHVIGACRAAGVRALVHTSTPSVVFDGTDMEGADESTPYPAAHHAPYPRSKAEAERRVLAADAGATGPADGLRTVALRPHLILGPGDTSLVPRILARARAGRLRRLSGPPRKVDITWIADAARAHLLAADRLLGDAPSCRGRAYFISSGRPLPSAEVIDRILQAAGLPPVTRTAPPWAAWTAALLFEGVWTALRRAGEPPLTRWVVRELATAHWFDISAAARDLGYAPEIQHETGFEALAAWLGGSPGGPGAA